jgi:hypothetical protein
MKKWYPPLVFGALFLMLCSMSIQGTSRSSSGADKLTDLGSTLNIITEDNSLENVASYSMMAADTQIINMPISAYKKETMKSCDVTVIFQNRPEHLYPDSIAHRDTVTICPPSNQNKQVLVTFTQFETAPGDTLLVFGSDKVDPNKQLGAFSGSGVSKTGGWVRSECDPSGCLTFVFATNGDNNKGIGWEAWVKCNDATNVNLVCPEIPSVKLDCEDTPYSIITIQAPQPVKICSETLDSFDLKIFDAHNHLCFDTCVQSPASITDTFAIGIYKAVWSSKKYPAYKKEKFFTVQGPSLVCNDDISVPLGSACVLDITPDMILERPCDTITDTLYYKIELTLGKGTKKTKKLVGGGGPGVPYPSISRDTLVKYGFTDVCGGTMEVTISQVYFEHTKNMTICNNGKMEVSCTASLHFSDQSPPYFYDYENLDTIAACDTVGLMSALKAPKVADNCDKASVSLGKIELIDDVDPCKTGKAVLTWRAVDFCGNENFLQDTIFIVRPTTFYNPGRTILNCNEGNSYLDAKKPGLVVGEIKNGVLTPRDTIELSTTDYTCGYILVPNDNQFPSNCGEKWIRQWKVLDWCNAAGGPVQIATQAVTITDTIAPKFVDCPDSTAIGGAKNPMYVDLGHFDCAINLTPEKIIAPRATDNCDPNPAVTMFRIDKMHDGKWDSLGTNLSDAGPLACDTFRIGWVASDICIDQKKTDTCYRHIIVRDVTKPTAVCSDQLNFSVGSDWARIVNVNEVDGGSWDACGIAKREISFDGIHWDTVAELSCNAFHDDPKLHLRVTDTKGNYNICWTRIKIKDDIYPSCGKLPDAEEWCDEFKSGELGASTDTNKNGLFDDEEYIPLKGAKLDSFNAKYGNPLDICDDNIKCHPMKIEQEYQLVEWPCGQTRIQRRYRAIDWGPNKSPWETQLIALKYRPNWKITLPKDWQGDCGEGFPDASIEIESGVCDQIAWEHEDKVFAIKGESCYKVERTYHIINWCLYKAGDKPYPLTREEDDHGAVLADKMINHNQFATNGYLTYIQVLKVHTFDKPVVTVNDVETCLSGDGVAHQPIPQDTVSVDAANCNEYRTFTAEASTCVDFATLDFYWSIYIDGVEVDSGRGGKFSYPVNTDKKYTVRFYVNDGCGNYSYGERDFMFTDCKKPVPYCRAGLSVEMGQDAKIAIWASDIDLNSFDNCTQGHNLHRRLWHASLGEPPSTINAHYDLPTNIEFDCNTFGSQIVRLYIGDAAGNWDYCTSVIDVQDNMNVCQNAAQAVVNGRIKTTDNKLMNDVTVTATSSNGDHIATVTKDGGFHFALSKTKNYSLKAEMDTNPLNGVTTFDLVLISKHILGLQTFSSPYQYIAADVNQSGTITAYDLVQLRQLILSITKKFPNNTSWKFVDATYQFTQLDGAAEKYRQTIELSNMDNLTEVEFMAVKTGDVNQSASFYQDVKAESRGLTTIQVADQHLKAGEAYTVDFYSPTNKVLEGYQFTIDFDDLELVELVEATAKKNNFGYNLTKRGLLTTSWNANGAADVVEDAKLFSLVFKARTSGLLSEKLSITSDITPAEAYETEGNITNVQLRFNSDQPADIQLYQNRPNPFRDLTNIRFFLPEAGKADLSILDVQGKVLKKIVGNYEGGYHEIQLNGADLPEKGVLYYQLTTDKKQVVKRMVVIE